MEVTQQDKALGLTERSIMIELNYEEFCSNPSDTLDSICHFLNLDPARFLQKIRQVQIKEQNYKWKEELDTDLVSKMNIVMEPLLSQNSYL